MPQRVTAMSLKPAAITALYRRKIRTSASQWIRQRKRSPNASISITTYQMISASGNDDTCSGVSCHTSGLTQRKSGNSYLEHCHFMHQLPLHPGHRHPTHRHHTKHYTDAGYSCAECHGQEQMQVLSPVIDNGPGISVSRTSQQHQRHKSMQCNTVITPTDL